MNNIWIKGIYLLVFTVITAWTAPASPGSLEQEAAKKINRRYLNTHDIAMKFTHETVFADFDEKSTGYGQLYVKKPAKMMWNYETPSPQKIYIEANTVTVYSPDLRQAVISDLAKNTSSMIPLRLLLGTSTLDQEFDIGSMEQKQGSNIFLLTPKPGTLNDVDKIRLIEKDSTIQSISIHFKNQNISTFVFSDFSTDKGIPDEVFIFTPPEGTEIINQKGT